MLPAPSRSSRSDRGTARQSATWVMNGTTLRELRDDGVLPARATRTGFVAVTEAVMPWSRFPAEDVVLGPEMRATGEVMGPWTRPGKRICEGSPGGPVIDSRLREPCSSRLPIGISRSASLRHLHSPKLGFRLLATEGTATFLRRAWLTGNTCR